MDNLSINGRYKPRSIETTRKTHALRAGGNYLVAAVEQLKDGGFHITFESAVKTGRFDQLDMVTDHVHFSIKKGETLRL